MLSVDETISVVIPTHNRAGLMRRALDSVLVQSNPPNEIIVVDDGSTDDTADIVARDYAAVRYLYQENRGVSAARNAGIRASQNIWIALLDSDDEWLPPKLARQIELVRKTPGVVLCHSDEEWIRNGRRVNPGHRHRKSGGYIFQRCLPLCVISPSSAMIRRSLFNEVGLFDESMPACEDYDMWLRICSRHEVHYIDEPLVVKHGGHADQLSRRFWGMDRWRIQALAKIVDANGLSRSDRRAAIGTLIGKIDVYLGGAAKRHKNDEIMAFTEMRRRYGAMMSAD